MNIVRALWIGGLLIYSGTIANAATIAETCSTHLNSTPEICDCLGEIAQSELDDDQRRFVIGAIEKDTATTEELRQSMPFEKLTEATMFMVSGPQQCASRL